MRIYARPIPDAKNAHKVKNDQGVVHVALLSTAILYLRTQPIHGKCIILLVFAYKMLSNHVVNCGTNFLNTLYIAPGQEQTHP